GSPAAPLTTGPSAALTWKAPLDLAPQKLDDVVHGTTLPPAACAVDQPAGNAPGAAPSKFSAKIVVAVRVPVSSVTCSVARPKGAPWMTCSARSMGVPATKSLLMKSVT